MRSYLKVGFISVLSLIALNGMASSRCRVTPLVTTQDTWRLIDSTSFVVRIPAGEKCYIYFDKWSDSLGIVKPSEGLTNLAKQAIEYAPDWLRIELADNFSRMDNSHQDTYANLILNVKDPYVDEVAFEIARLAPQTLQHADMNTNMLIDNVELLYRIDSVLPYVEIKDVGSASQGGDYYSTVRYKVKQGGNIVEYNLPMSHYYWFIVHPKLHDEFPAYINPSTGSQASPPTGVFWRDYLFYHADGGYSLLKDAIDTCQTLWNNKYDTFEDNGAIGALAKWTKEVLPWGRAHSPRIPQPVYTYHWHTGTCSEHTWFHSAIGRIALMPTVTTVMSRNNHRINQFWERKWYAVETVGMTILNSHPECYDGSSWGKEIRGVYNWRGDGYTWLSTEMYTFVCTLTVNVKDANDNPVDGACIELNAPYWETTLYSHKLAIGYTDNAGQFQFLIGDSVPDGISGYYTGKISSSFGTVNRSISEMTGPGEHYKWDINLSGTMPQLKVNSTTAPSDDHYKVEFDINVPHQIVYGKNVEYGQDNRDYDTFSEFLSPGNIDLFTCDSGNFAKYTSGNQFDAYIIHKDISSIDTSFVFPKHDFQYLVLSNEEANVIKEVVKGSIQLYKNRYSGVEEVTTLPKFGLSCNPSLFGWSTKLCYGVDNKAKISLNIYNLSGQIVRNLVNKKELPGSYTIIWDGRDNNGERVISGIYFCRFTAGNFKITRKILLIR